MDFDSLVDELVVNVLAQPLDLSNDYSIRTVLEQRVCAS